MQGIEVDVAVALDGEAFYLALNDDLNTPLAIAEIHALAKQLHKAKDDEKPSLKARLLAAGNMIGILQQAPSDWLQGDVSDEAITAETIEGLIEARKTAKLAKDYALADQIREELLGQGVVLEDSQAGTRWRRG